MVGGMRNEVPSGPSQCLSRVFGIDLRSLALFRIALAWMLLWDLGIRLTDLRAMYTDGGMFPRALVGHYFPAGWHWSFHFGSGEGWVALLLFGLASCAAVALMIGFHTQLASVVCWLFLVSLHNRLPPVLTGGDNLLRMLAFWGMLLPLGHVWSWDARRAGRRVSGEVCTVASAGVLLQMALMYLCSAVFKGSGDWWQGQALAGILQHDFYARPLAKHLLEWPAGLSAGTYVVVMLEWLAPFLLLVPWRTELLRMIMVALLMALHLGIALFLSVGIFPYACLVGLSLFLPRAFWDRLCKRETSPSPSRLRAHGLMQWVASVALGYVALANVTGLPGRPLEKLKVERWEPFWTAWGWGQKWNMFGAVPSKDGWYVAQGELANGRMVDVLADGAPLKWERPLRPLAVYPNHRWEKVFREMAYYDSLGYQVYRAPIGKYLCQEWNRVHEPSEHLVAFSFVYCQESDDEGDKPLRETLLRLDFGDASTRRAGD